jgi:excisionase family DNA binding protein
MVYDKSSINTEYIGVTELAATLGISRMAVVKRIQKGQIPASKVGRAYIIPKSVIGGISNTSVGPQDQQSIERVVRKTMKEYGETIRRLGSE